MSRGLLLALIVLVGIAEHALARPGGGGSYSGGGGHGGGGGGGGGDGFFELIYWLLRLIIEVPQIGIPVTLIVIGYFIVSAYRKHQNKDWDSGPPVELAHAIDLDDLRRVDPDFSRVLFEDFAFRLFSTAHRARHSDQAIATIAPYVDAPARTALRTRPPENVPVVSVIVGAMRVTELDAPTVVVEGRPTRVRISIEFEANVLTADHTYYSVELWRFARDAAVRTKPPGTRSFPCPNCGAPWQASQSGTQVCASCGEVVDNGRFDWTVDLIGLRSLDERPPTLLDDVVERGTDLPTYHQDGVDRHLLALTADDPETHLPALISRLELIYDQLNQAWATNDLRPARGLISDGLYDYLSYWIEAYKAQDLRNALENMRITHTALAKVSRDRWYDAVTIRIFATGLDYTVQASTGKVLKGSKRSDRRYSEYWTLIRAANRKGAPVAKASCSNCGAPLAITQSGECEHCGQHVTSGEFDWVLSKIEQDDSYRG
jgi:hypothetical protein